MPKDSFTKSSTGSSTVTQSTQLTNTQYITETFDLTKTPKITPDYVSLMNNFTKEVQALSNHELDQAFHFSTTPGKVTLPLHKAGQAKIMNLYTQTYPLSEEFSEVTIEAIKAAAKIINEQAGKNLVNIKDKVSFLDKRNTVSTGVIDKNNAEFLGLVLYSQLDYFIGSHSDLSTKYNLQQCLAQKTEIKDPQFLRCVSTAMHEMMHLFGVSDLSVKFDATKDFYLKMDRNCAHNSAKGRVDASIMYYQPSLKNQGQHCFDKELTLDKNGNVKLSILDEKLIQRIKEKGNEVQAFEIVRGISSGFVNTAFYSLINLVICGILESKCTDPLWKKLGVEKNARNIEIASHIIGFAVSFSVVTSTSGLIPAAGLQGQTLLGNIGGKILKEKLDKAYPDFSGPKTDFVLKHMLPCVLMSAGVGITNLNVKNTINSTINALGSLVGGASFILMYEGMVKCTNSIKNRRNQRNMVAPEPVFEGVLVVGNETGGSRVDNSLEASVTRQAEDNNSQNLQNPISSNPEQILEPPVILAIEESDRRSNNANPNPSILSPAALEISSSSSEKSR